jgi:hypothetical protein
MCFHSFGVALKVYPQGFYWPTSLHQVFIDLPFHEVFLGLPFHQVFIDPTHLSSPGVYWPDTPLSTRCFLAYLSTRFLFAYLSPPRAYWSTSPPGFYWSISLHQMFTGLPLSVRCFSTHLSSLSIGLPFSTRCLLAYLSFAYLGVSKKLIICLVLTAKP